MKTIVAGASGVVGRAVIEHHMTLGQAVVGISRRAPADLPAAPFQTLDLLDTTACAAIAAEHCDATHLVYAALYEKPRLIAGWREHDQMQTNLTMLQNLLAPLGQTANIEHVTLLQGTKAYGAHVEPMRIPGREASPRHAHENFYWLQEDYLREWCADQGSSFTIWRPQIIFGHALHAPMNLLAAIGVFAALQWAKREPLFYPGGPAGVTEAIDANLLARAITFGQTATACRGETYNVTNGDVCRWPDLFPALAKMLDMPFDAVARPTALTHLYDAELAWTDVVAQHELQPLTIRELVGDSFHYADALFNVRGHPTPPPALLSTIKLRQAGFGECIDTEAMFEHWFGELRRLRILP